MDRPSLLRPFKTALCAGTLVMAAAGGANAEIVSHFFYQNGGNACTGALPTYEGALRKRPKAIVNQGDVPAYATCSAMSDAAIPNPNRVLALAYNRGTIPVEMSCTMVNGDEVDGANYVVSTRNLPVGQPTQFVWVPLAPKPVFQYGLVGVSCLLPPNVEIDTFAYYVDETI